MSRDSLSVGVDLGGTKTEAVLLRAHEDRDPPFEVLHRERVETRAVDGYDAVLADTAALIERVARHAPGPRPPVGVGMPGGVRRRDNCVKNSNATCLNGRPFREDLQRALGAVIAFENDANCFALAETLLGAGRAHREGVVFGVILGSGVGGGLVLHGRVWGGLHGIAGEWGHHPVRTDPDARPCYCGQRGCLERYASGPAVESAYLSLGGEPLALADIVARRAVDPLADRCVTEMLSAFGRGLATLVDVLDPSCVVLGGGVSHVAALYSEGVSHARACVFNDEWLTPVVQNALGDGAGVLGAAALARALAR
jgi:fructokinase